MKKPETNKTDKTFEVEYTEADRAEMREAGYAEDELPAPGKHAFRRARHITPRKEQKIKITMLIDADILDYFKERATAENAAPYQTQINNELRRVMETAGKAVADASATRSRQDFLNDTSFLRELKEKLATV